MEPGRNRVFVNPNFNKGIMNTVPVKQVAVMHVNPNFYKHPQNVQPVPKIYINPNFVRPNDLNKQTHLVHNTSSTHHAYGKPSPLMDSSNTLTVPVLAPTKHGVHSSVQTKTATVQPFQTHSRYSLVRQKKVEEPLPNISKPQSSTIKISKYKSIKITDIKKNLDSVAPTVKVAPFKISKDHKSMIRTSSNQKVIPKTLTSNVSNRYRLVRPTASVGKPQFKRQSSITKKISNRIKAGGVYKKNNIPCPQYRKYGKCLRRLYGKCEFLHDKKHVSICRNFLNGVCHNDACLLSHELSDKKMPTCYFYLKGMCTKEGCPYLHVKLNEKAKICTDFVRGYCEKGDKCLNRHVASTTTKPSNTGLKRRQSLKKPSLQKLKYKLEKNRTKSNTSNTQKRKSKTQLNQKSCQEHNNTDGRYYKDNVQESSTTDESLEMIKPMRCKLGTLPSFIQL